MPNIMLPIHSLLPAHKTSSLFGSFFHIANSFEVTDILENKSKTFVDLERLV